MGPIAQPWNKDDHKEHQKELLTKLLLYTLGNSPVLEIYETDFACDTVSEISGGKSRIL